MAKNTAKIAAGAEAAETKAAKAGAKVGRGGVKPKAAPETAEKPAKAVKPVKATTTTATDTSVDAKGLRIKTLLERIDGKTSVAKKDAREVSEAVLAVLGEAIAAGEGVTLPGLGRLKLVKRNTRGQAEVLTLKLRRVAIDGE